MAYPILVATAHTPFGELIRLSLEETRRYHVQVVETGAAATRELQTNPYTVAIADGDIMDLPIALLVDLAGRGLKLFIVPPSNERGANGLATLPLTGTVLRPFYLPDLLDMVAEAVVGADPTPPPPPPISLPDEHKKPLFDAIAAEEFSVQLAKTSALAGLWFAPGREPYLAGSAVGDVARELNVNLERYWQKGDRGDLVRYVRLPVAEGDCQLFLTTLADEEALALAFSNKVPLSKIRSQAGKLVHSLERYVEITNPSHLKNVEVNADEDAWFIEETSQLLNQPASQENESKVLSFDSIKSGLRSAEAGLSEDKLDPHLEAQLRDLDLAVLLGAIPTPDPQEGLSEAAASQWMPEDLPPTLVETTNSVALPWEGPVDPPSEAPTSVPHLNDEVTQPVTISGSSADPRSGKDPARQSLPIQFEESAKVLSFDSKVVSFHSNDPQADTVKVLSFDSKVLSFDSQKQDLTNPLVLTPPTSLSQLETDSAGMSQIYYTCVLIPCLPQHYLTREIGERVGQWVQQLCLAFGWRLEGIAIRPEYLQWMVQTPPSVAPGSLVKVIRQRTSHYLFNTFERLRDENPSDDFWASGYLIISGIQPPSAKLLREYIRETRRRQGITPPWPDRSVSALNEPQKQSTVF